MTDEYTDLLSAVDSLWIEAGGFRRDIYRNSFAGAKSSIASMRNETPTEIREWAAARDRARETADKSGADRITILPPDFEGKP